MAFADNLDKLWLKFNYRLMTDLTMLADLILVMKCKCKRIAACLCGWCLQTWKSLHFHGMIMIKKKQTNNGNVINLMIWAYPVRIGYNHKWLGHKIYDLIYYRWWRESIAFRLPLAVWIDDWRSIKFKVSELTIGTASIGHFSGNSLKPT